MSSYLYAYIINFSSLYKDYTPMYILHTVYAYFNVSTLKSGCDQINSDQALMFLKQYLVVNILLYLDVSSHPIFQEH